MILFILLSFYSNLLASDQAFEFVRSMAVAECATINNDTWLVYGIKECEGVVPIISTNPLKEEKEFYKRWIGFTEQFKERNKEMNFQKDSDLLLWYLKNRLKRSNLKDEQKIIELFAPAREISKMIFAISPIDSDEKNELARKLLSRINSTRWFENHWHNLVKTHKSNERMVLPLDLEVRDYLDSEEGYLAGIESVLKPLMDDESENDWKKIKRNLVSYRRYLKEKILPSSRKNISISSDWYQLLLEEYGVEISAEELMSSAEDSYQKTMKEYKVLAKSLAKELKLEEQTPKAVLEALSKNGVTNWADVGSRYRESEKKLAEIIQANQIVTLPGKPLLFRPASENESSIYPSPAILFPKNASMDPVFIIPIQKDGTFLKSQTYPSHIMALLAHEGRPGHDLQIRKMFEYSPSIVTMMYSDKATAYAEGWALYAEELVYNHFDPQTKFSSLMYRLLRQARAFLDPKLNLGEMKLAEVEAILKNELGLPDEFVASELRRYTFLYPAQATTYFAGYSSFKKLRATFEKEWAKKFNNKCFHDGVLKLGGMPFKQLEDTLRQQKPCG